MSTSLETLARLTDGTIHLAGAQYADGERIPPVWIASVGINAQKVGAKGLFAAVPGTKTHGAKWASQSEASAILTDASGLSILQSAGEKRPVLVVENVRDVLGAVASEVYGNPSKKLTVIGVTGTSGKTTVSYLLEAGLTHCGYKVGLIGTTGTRIAGTPVPTQLTTPEAPVLQELFADMVAQDVTHVVMEVSSHALMLGRVGGTDFDVAGFTNLSQDHLDFHHSMEEYFNAKALFFKAGSPVRGKTPVICVDDEWGQKMAVLAGPAAVTLSTGVRPATVMATEPELKPDGTQEFTLMWQGKKITVDIPLPGRFNIANAALAVTCAAVAGANPQLVAEGLDHVVVPGRMQTIRRGQNFTAIVDYAHKPAAVAAVLDTLREQTPGRIGIVLGAGGDRDRGKRPLMGAAAGERADLVIITDDNPRSEDPVVIRQEVAEGARLATPAPRGKKTKPRPAEIRIIGDRADAIQEAVTWAREGDAIIVAGKGHETGQIIGDEIHPFDDREVLAGAIDATLRDNGGHGAAETAGCDPNDPQQKDDNGTTTSSTETLTMHTCMDADPEYH